MTDMESLFKQAEEQKLWFWSRYQDLWFSPAKLRIAQSVGQFRWGAVNWELRDPRERVSELRQRAQELNKQEDDMEREINL